MSTTTDVELNTATPAHPKGRSLHYEPSLHYVVNAWVGVATHSALIMYVTEFMGALLLNLSITMHSESELYGSVQPFAVAATIVCIVGSGAAVSGAHYNPNLTLAFWLCGDRKAPNPIIYVVIALVGAFCGNLISFGLDGFAGGLPTLTTWTATQWVQACFCEFIAAALSTYNVMYVALLARPPLGTAGPVVVALGFFSPVMAFRSISGALINPGVTFGVWLTAVINGTQQNIAASLLLYWLAQLLGALAAGGCAAVILRSRKADATKVVKASEDTA